jgi:hypothetical protein
LTGYASPEAMLTRFGALLSCLTQSIWRRFNSDRVWFTKMSPENRGFPLIIAK